MNIETLQSSFEPIEQYQRFLLERHFVWEKEAVDIKPIDAFVMKQLAGSVPRSPTIVDFSADDTCGASSVFWASNKDIKQLLIARVGKSGGESIWEQYANELSQNKAVSAQLAALQFIDGSSDASVLTPIIKAVSQEAGSIILHLTTLEKSPGAFFTRLRELISLGHDPIFVLSPFERMGSCPALATILKLQAEFPQYGFALVREVTPFLAASSLGILYPRKGVDIPGLLRRVGQLFEGNFDYISLLRDHLQLTLEHKRLGIKHKLLQAKQPREVPVETPAPALPPPPIVDRNVIPIPDPPQPLFIARVLQSCYRALLPSQLRISLAKHRSEYLRGLRVVYHQKVPLLYRIVLRDVRVLFLGR